MNPFIQNKTIRLSILIASVVACFALLPTAQAQLPSPPPDGDYTNGNTAEGAGALGSLTPGPNAAFNTAIGAFALANSTLSDNTAVGAFALGNNTTGRFNTATAGFSLEHNTTGSANTATGYLALRTNNTGVNNTAIGASALQLNTTGNYNMASGFQALFSNTTGEFNTAIGAGALFFNTADENTATGAAALVHNTTGEFNTAAGSAALYNNTTGVHNTANGYQTLLSNTTGNDNVALGFLAGNSQTTGSNNVYIGSNLLGVAGESNACYIASIFGQTAIGIPVFINQNNKLGTVTSSARFKRDIHDMDKASEALFALRPVAFRYNEEIDPAGISQLGLVAEDVEKVNPDLVVRDKEGKPYSVRYDQVNAMLLNEFLKEHKAFVEEHRTVEELKKQVAALTAGLQKVSAQLEVSRPAPQVVENKE